MDDLKDILLEGEEVLWSGAPDPSLAPPPKAFWVRKVRHAAILIVVAICVAALIWAARAFPNLGLVCNTIAVVCIVGLIPGTLVFFDFKDSADDVSKHRYYLTSDRLIVFMNEKGVTKEVYPNSVIAIEAYTREPNCRLNLFYGQSDDEFVSLVGLTDFEAARKLITNKLAPRSSES